MPSQKPISASMYKAIIEAGQQKKQGGRPSPAPSAQETQAGPPLATRTAWMLIADASGLPMPPSVNSCYFTDRRTGRRVMTKDGKVAKATIAARFQTVKVDPAQWLRLEIILYLPLMYQNGKRRRFDASNRVKLLEDAVCEGLGVDDSAVLEILVRKVDAADYSVAVDVYRSTI